MKKRVAIIGTNGIPAKYGGFETLAEFLAKHLGNEYDVTIYCSKTPKNEQISEYFNVKLVYLPFKANGWQSMIYDAVSIFHAFIKSDVLIVLGFSGVFAFPFKPLFQKKIIFNIGGVEWKKVRGSKLTGSIEIFVKWWFEKICVKFSDIIITDNQALWNYVFDTYKIESVLAEYGGDHAKHTPLSNDIIKTYPFLSENYDVSISRAQEDMNIHILIDAYKKIGKRNLVLISNWHISEYGINLKKENDQKYRNIYLLDAIYDKNILNAIRSNAKIYLHSHSLCGTAPSLVEAMSLGLPILSFDVETNRETTEKQSIYFSDVESLVQLLGEIDKEKIDDLGINMKKIANKRYTWARIAELYKNAIDSITQK